MNKKLLFCAFDIAKSNSSSAIRNRKLITELEKHYDLTKLDIISLHDNNKKTPYLDLQSNLSESTPSKNNKRKTNALKEKYIRPLLKAIIPDRFFIGMMKHHINADKMTHEKLDYIITSSDPKSIHLLIYNTHFNKLFSNNNPVYIQYWGDPWYDDINIKSNFLTKLFESWIISKGDIIIYNSMATLSTQKKLFPKYASKMHYLSRGISSTINAMPDNKTYLLSEKIKLLYTGDYSSSSRNINFLVKAVSETSNQLTIVGHGSINESNHKNIQLIPRVSPEKINEFVIQADMLVVLMNHNGSQIPGKIFDYISEDKPILVLYEKLIPPELEKFSDRLIFIDNNYLSIKKFLMTSIEVKEVSVGFKTSKNHIFPKEMNKFVNNILESHHR